MKLCKNTVFAALAAGVVCAVGLLHSQMTAPAPDPRKILDQYCVNCHNQRLRIAGIELDRIDASKPTANADVWEREIAKLRAGSMPPPSRSRFGWPMQGMGIADVATRG